MRNINASVTTVSETTEKLCNILLANQAPCKATGCDVLKRIGHFESIESVFKRKSNHKNWSLTNFGKNIMLVPLDQLCTEFYDSTFN